MPIQEWSDRILVVELGDEPQLSEDIANLMRRLNHHAMDVVISLGDIQHINSSGLSQLLRVRTKMLRSDRKLRLCSIPNEVWGVMLVTGLDKIFEFSPDVSTALAALQIAG
jgi:anti-anti-sigma factor